ncbi:uncharacterized mitochondrial protein AtMg00810-like [Impatiens glandulifera]|uniref:uncharacterized mitochondrial protein AtMg00810-like n=1 Tax=Impatiens glandulifera TaxID=253017 RepID=UPI001FB0EB78|nr:uncharacterized mitochondrial protein AtMg00810-like [Impatiens glandulifera]
MGTRGLARWKKTIGLKWVYKVKYSEDGLIQKHKARLVAKGYSQQPGVGFSEIYAPVARMETIRTCVAIAAQLEAPRAWNSKINSYFIKKGFNRSTSESSLYVKTIDKDFLIVCLYVDDLIYFGTNKAMVEEFKNQMMKEFEMTDLGLMKYFLGIQVKQSPGRIFLSQEKYIEDLLKKFNMSQCKPLSTLMALNKNFQVNDDGEKADSTSYRKLIGSLIYLNTRPNITHSVSLLSRFLNEQIQIHFAAAKRILRYLKGTKTQGIEFKKESKCKLVGYTDSDWAGSIDDRKSTSGYIFCLGSNVISWSSRKQKFVALSSAEAEYIACIDAACEAVWLQRILKDMKFEQCEPTIIHCDNMSSIAMTKNPIFHARSKHIELRYHFIRYLVTQEVISMKFIKTEDQPADIMTKVVTIDKFDKFKKKLKITN